jgi:hypothetical protein
MPFFFPVFVLFMPRGGVFSIDRRVVLRAPGVGDVRWIENMDTAVILHDWFFLTWTCIW